MRLGILKDIAKIYGRWGCKVFLDIKIGKVNKNYNA
jgi:hypothetical protein